MDTSAERERYTELRKRAAEVRLLSLEAGYYAGADRKPHLGPAFSIADIVTALYFGVMNVDPQNPKDPHRDRFILSKGHACISVYAALAARGFFPREQLRLLRHPDGFLQGHPEMTKTPGIDMTTGSLGNGFGAAVGMAIAARMERRQSIVYTLVGDGELNEGLVWEGAQAAVKYQLTNLIAFVDINGLQSGDSCDIVMPPGDIEAKWKAFGWMTYEVDGHDMEALLLALQLARKNTTQPSVILARTVKGKGVSFMENNNGWHQRAPNEQEYQAARSELEKELM